MNKPVFGLRGRVLWIFDGLSGPELYYRGRTRSWESLGSTFKGLITGVCIGYFAKKVSSSGLGISGTGGGDVLHSWCAMPNGRQALLFRDLLPGQAFKGRWSVSQHNDIKVATRRTEPHHQSGILRKGRYAPSVSLRDSPGQHWKCCGILTGPTELLVKSTRKEGHARWRTVQPSPSGVGTVNAIGVAFWMIQPRMIRPRLIRPG